MIIDSHFLQEQTAQKIRQWKHRGFSVYQSFQAEASDDEDKERLAHYIARAPISNRKLTCDQEKDVMAYTAHKGQNSLPGFQID